MVLRQDIGSHNGCNMWLVAILSSLYIGGHIEFKSLAAILVLDRHGSLLYIHRLISQGLEADLMSLAKRVKDLEAKLKESEDRLKKARELANQTKPKSARKTPKNPPVIHEQRY